MEKTVERTCEHCGETFRVIPSRLNHGRGKNCSPKCQYDSIRARPSKANVLWFDCLNCGDNFWRYASRIEDRKGAGKYCTRKCRDIHRRGENSPNFIHGDGTNWHGDNWYAQRRKAKKRDNYCCVKCDITESDCVIKFTQPLHVHHKIPFRKFDNDFVLANKLGNLETLCPKCHREEEGEYQRNERLSTNL